MIDTIKADWARQMKQHRTPPLKQLKVIAFVLLVLSGVLAQGTATPDHGDKLGPALQQLLETLAAQGVTRETAQTHDLSDFSTPLVKIDSAGLVQTFVYVSKSPDELVEHLASLRCQIELINLDHGIFQVQVPFYALEAVAKLDTVSYLHAPDYSVSADMTVSEGDTLLQADRAREVFDLDGSGVKVAVVSDGVDSLAQAQALGELPEVKVLRPGHGDEGTAMLELVHDLAPGASLAFTTGFNTSLEMIAHLEELTQYAFGGSGVDVIVDDIMYLGQPAFEDGPLAKTIADIVASGVTYITSAGNWAEKFYRATFVPQSYGGSVLHNFGAAANGPDDIAMGILLPAGSVLTAHLQWNDTYGAANSDYNLYLYDNTLETVLAISNTLQRGQGHPLEFLSLSNPTAETLAVKLVVEQAEGETELLEIVINCNDCRTLTYALAEGSISPGHQRSSSVITVGAVNGIGPGDIVASYSSRGPVEVFFPVWELRDKPDMVAVDGSLISGVGGFGHEFPAGSGVRRFFGTSAAAPHVAGVAALLLQAAPHLTPEQIKEVLIETAFDLGAPGFDATFGAGRIDALAALQHVTGEQTTPSKLTGTP